MRQLPTGIQAQLKRLQEKRGKLEAGLLLAPNTVAGYAEDWKMFSAWCDQVGRTSLPATAETLSLYLTEILCEGRKVTTAVRRVSGVQHMHRSSCHPSPVTGDIWALLSGARRLLRERPRQKDPLTVDQLRTISRMLARDGTALAIRNRAIIVVGLASALRRASLVELLVSDVEFTEEGAVIHVRYEKQDQEGRGRFIGLPLGQHPDTCPVACLKDWLAHRGLADGALFRPSQGKNRSGHLEPEQIGRIVKRCVARIGLDPAKYGGHSLRSGFVTAAGEAGAGELLIAAQTGHRSMEILRQYFRRRNLFRANAYAMIGL